MFATALRLAAKKAIEPHVSPEEAHRLADLLHNILKQHGPLSVERCWAHAQPAGLRSKRHMKMMLRWMRERQRVRIICNPLKELGGAHGDKEFLYAPFYHKPKTYDADRGSHERRNKEIRVKKQDNFVWKE